MRSCAGPRPRRDTTRTSWPASASSWAVAEPTGPAPTITCRDMAILRAVRAVSGALEQEQCARTRRKSQEQCSHLRAAFSTIRDNAGVTTTAGGIRARGRAELILAIKDAARRQVAEQG